MKLKQDLIEKLRNGEIAVKNDGTIEQLEAVLREAFPNDDCNDVIEHDWGEFDYFYKLTNESDSWYGNDITNLDSVSVKDFFKSEEGFKNGGEVEYRLSFNCGYTDWQPAIYISENPIECDRKHIIVNSLGVALSVSNIRHKPNENSLVEQLRPYVDKINRLNIEIEGIINKAVE